MGRSTMLNAAASSAGYDAYQPKSVQQGPGKRGERELSYNSGRDAMNKKLNQTAAPKSTPTAVSCLGPASNAPPWSARLLRRAINFATDNRHRWLLLQVWFIAGALIMGMLYMFNAFSAQAAK